MGSGIPRVTEKDRVLGKGFESCKDRMEIPMAGYYGIRERGVHGGAFYEVYRVVNND